VYTEKRIISISLATRQRGTQVRKFMFVATTFAVFGVGIAIPAEAAVTGGTPATFTLNAGALSITAPAGPVSLGSQLAATTATTMSGSLGSVTVSDQRGGTTTWIVSVISGAFTPSAGPADPASNLSYAAGAVTDSANVVATAVAATDLTGQSTVMTGASSGISTATWNPTITVIVPANFAPGTYGATITHSVA
jgi:hypothetical protein